MATRALHGKPAPRFLRVRAMLAGALVLGVGGTLTLASWTDTEHASGSFATSVFRIQGSADGAAFMNHSEASPETLVFTLNSQALSPGSVAYAKYVVRTSPESTVEGTVRLGGASVDANALGSALTYGVRQIAVGSTCNQANFNASSTIIVPNASSLTHAGERELTLSKNAGAPVAYCFAVTLPTNAANTLQGLTATARWTFTGTSSA